jgi:NAD(P)-dependent dehydrogenase (short-subunit alcohol dehydrogenase family)
MSTSPVLGPGRTALVTGASRGIGALIAREIASHGGHVVLSGLGYGRPGSAIIARRNRRGGWRTALVLTRRSRA